MRRTILALAVLTVLTVPLGAMAIPSHEDYDRARIDLSALDWYLGKALAHLATSLSTGASGDYISARNESQLFSDHFERGDATLRGMSPDLDSYDYLTVYIQAMGSAQNNLSIAMDALGDHSEHIIEVGTFSSSSWTRESLSENLSVLDRSIMGLRATRATALPACIGLRHDLVRILELNDSGALSSSLSDMDRIIANVSTIPEDVPFGPHMRTLFRPLMEEWALDLASIAHEADPPHRIDAMLYVLGPVVPSLSQELSWTIGQYMDGLSNASDLDLVLRDRQMDLLACLDDLNESVAGRSDMTEQLSLLRAAESSYSALLSSFHSAIEEYRVLRYIDHGGVNASMNDLSDLLEGYRGILDGIELVFDELSTSLGQLTGILLANVLGADADGDGNISPVEAKDLSLPDGLGVQLNDASSFLSLIEGIVSSMDPRTASIYQGPVEALGDLYDQIALFQASHGSFLEGIDAGPFHARGVSDDMLGSLSFLTTMEGALASISLAFGSLEVSGLHPDMDVLQALAHQVDLYRDLLLELMDEAGVGSVLKLVLTDTMAPYDASIGLGIMAVERTPEGQLIFPGPVQVVLTMEWGTVAILEMGSGSIGSSLVVERGFPLGDHTLTARIDLGGGRAISDSTNLTVRRLVTWIGAEGPMDLEPSEEGRIDCWVKDEHSRPVDGNISHEGKAYKAGTEPVPIVIPRAGKHIAVLSYEGDPWHSPSNLSVSIDVAYRPIMDLTPRLSVVPLGSTANITWGAIRASGRLSIRAGEMVLDIGTHRNGSTGILSLDTGPLGLGNHSAILELRSDAPWCRDGRSLPAIIWVLTPAEYMDWTNRTKEKTNGTVHPPVDNETPPDLRPVRPIHPEEDGGPWGFLPGWLSGPLEMWGVFVLALLMVSMTLVLLLLYRRRPITRQITSSSSSVPFPGNEVPIGTPSMRRTPRKGPRDRMIDAYCDMVERIPEVGGHMTPREVSGRLAHGGPIPVHDAIPEFEKGLYSKQKADDPAPIVDGLRKMGDLLSRRSGRGSS